MKTLFWNIRGVANSPSKLALKRLIIVNKPDFVFIAEPWMTYDRFPSRWLNRLGLKLFSVNNRDNLNPNLWCICSIHLNPTILSISDQYVAFSITENNKTFCMAAIYASTCYIKRRALWNDLTSLIQQHNLPFCLIGNFNTILEACEHRGRLAPARLPMNEFQNWSNLNDLFHIPTRGASFTWENRRSGRFYTKRRLDRAISNHAWLDFCTSLSCSTLIRTNSDHYPLLLDFQFSDCTFKSQFRFMKMWSLHDNCKDVISSCWNNRVIGCPMYVLNKKLKILKNTLKDWNKTTFGNVHALVESAENKVAEIQHNIQQNGHFDELLNQEKDARLKIEIELKKQE